MSRKGKAPISIPAGVEVTCKDGIVHVKGPKATLTLPIKEGFQFDQKDGMLHLILVSEAKSMAQFHGLYRALIQNMVIGVDKGFEQRLEMVGVGYRASVQGHLLDLQVGFSHPTKLEIPSQLKVAVEKNTEIIITGADRQQVGEFAAQVRKMRPPEPYQGKGIRRKGEHVRKKAGKAAASKK